MLITSKTLKKADKLQNILLKDGSFDLFAECLAGDDSEEVVFEIMKRAKTSDLLDYCIRRISMKRIGLQAWFEIDEAI